MDAGLAHALIAEFERPADAHVILMHFGRTCWYFYGASANEERQRMPNYLLQWEAMRWARANGCTVYDFWGAPDVFDEGDGIGGVFNFKRGFRGVVTRHIGAWDYAPFPPLYRAYTGLWPRVLARLKRRAVDGVIQSCKSKYYRARSHVEEARDDPRKEPTKLVPACLILVLPYLARATRWPVSARRRETPTPIAVLEAPADATASPEEPWNLLPFGLAAADPARF